LDEQLVERIKEVLAEISPFVQVIIFKESVVTDTVDVPENVSCSVQNLEIASSDTE
jgi:hypothetical protein